VRIKAEFESNCAETDKRKEESALMGEEMARAEKRYKPAGLRKQQAWKPEREK
jgi:hypothetical protein